MNREIVLPSGAGIYPLQGDVTSQAGSPNVTVTGLQTIPVLDTFLDGGELLTYNNNTHKWTPLVQSGIQVNGLPASFDYEISVNVAKQITVNGV